MLSGLLLFVAATALLVHGWDVAGVLLAFLGLVLLILGRPQPSVADVIRKGEKRER
jgi:membrane protein implicated in regulation of membrane protease activity